LGKAQPEAAAFTIRQGATADGIVEIPNEPVDLWKVPSALLKLNNCETFRKGKDNMGRQVQENSLHLTPYEDI